MAFSVKLIIFSLLVSLTLSRAQSSPKPKALLLPVTKDASTLQYTTLLNLGTPAVPRRLVVDLGNRYAWFDCYHDYRSSTYKPGFCGSAACSAARVVCAGTSLCFETPGPGCHNNTCDLYAENTISGHVEIEELAIDSISLRSTDGSKAGPPVSVSNFIFSCARYLILDLAKDVEGMLGLGRFPIGLPNQLSSAFGGTFRRKFAICLPSKLKSNGVIFFGDTPYVFYPGYNKSKAIDVSSRFQYTKLLTNPVTPFVPHQSGESSSEYFVGVTSILVNKKPISINTTLLSIDRRGNGGSKISTVRPYGVLESTIYRALVTKFDEEIGFNVTKVTPVAPFNDCYSIGNLGMSLLGLSVPDIAFVFENKNVFWELHGANSVVGIGKDVACLGFLDGGLNPRTSIVFGGLQLQDNLLQFDLAASRLAFTSTLLFEEIECSNFKS